MPTRPRPYPQDVSTEDLRESRCVVTCLSKCCFPETANGLACHRTHGNTFPIDFLRLSSTKSWPSSMLSSSSHHRQTHHRRTSDDSITRRSQSSHTQIPSSYSQHSLPRGRSMQNVQQLPSPWTAMPTQMGVIPTAMPYYHHTPKAVPSRRQTTLT